ncbi:MAG: DnaA N-terminal domain-containing protein [Desulfobacterales bacterium]
MEKVWQKVKDTIKDTLPTHVYKMWIEPVHFKPVKALSCPARIIIF